MSEKCTTCDKPIDGHEIFGPYHFPMCYACYCQHEQDLIDIINSQSRGWGKKSHYEIRRELRARHGPNGELLRQIQEIKEQIAERKRELEDFDDEIWELKSLRMRTESRLSVLENKLRDLAKAAPA